MPLYSGADAVFWTPPASVTSLLSIRNNYTQTLNGIKAVISEANKMNKDYGVFNEAIKNQIEIMVPKSVEEVLLLSELREISDKSGVAMEDLGVKDKGMGEYSVNFTIKSTYANFKKFMMVYEKSMRLLTLKGVSFDPSKDESAIVKFNVSLSTYYTYYKK
jgi:Tfp pilus assembly protein PilO